MAAEELDAFLASMPAYPGGCGRGILMPAGGEYLVGAYAVIAALRGLGCDLPVEIWHQGPGELTPIAHAILRRWSGVTFHDIGRAGAPRERGGWQLKAEALAATGLREVLLLDADNLPLDNPGFLFNFPIYRHHGTVFWPGVRHSLWPDNECWARVGLEPQEHVGLDSGQMLVDRERAWPGVSLAAWMNRRSATYWRGLWGDRDTFLLAWLKTGTPCRMIDRRPAEIPGAALIQYGPDRTEAFQHRFGAKWKVGENQILSDYPAERIAHELLRQLSASSA